MNEVSCRMMIAVRTLFIANELDWRWICAVPARSEDFLFNPKNRIHWEEYVGVCERALVACGSEARFHVLANRLGSGNQMLPLRRFARACFSAESFYRAFGAFHCSLNFGNVVSTVVKGGAEGSVAYEIFLRSGAVPCYPFFLSAEGALAGLPQLLGYPPSKVVPVSVTDSYAKFTIEPPEFKNLYTRIVALFESPARLFDAHSLAKSHEQAMMENFRTISQQKHDLESVFEASSEAIAVVADGRVAHANRAFAEIMRIPAGVHVTGRKTSDWLDESQLQVLRTWASAASDAKGRRDVRLKTDAGGSVVVEVAAPRSVSWENKPATLWMFRDVSGERELREALALASEREQRKIAHDLHDGLGQEMTALGLHIKVLQNRLEADLHPASADAARLVDMSSTVARHARDIAHGLAPQMVLDAGLIPALGWLASHVEDIFGMKVSIATSAENTAAALLPIEASSALYRASQEILNNARRHGRATEVRVVCSEEDSFLWLTFSDNGCGFPKVAAIARGMGLKILKHRVEILNGRLEFGDRKDAASGAWVRIGVPASTATRVPETGVQSALLSPRSVLPTLDERTGAFAVMIVDDHAIVRDGVESLLGQNGRFQVRHKLSTCEEAIAVAPTADIAVVDLMIGEQSGIDLIRMLRSQNPKLLIVAFSMGARELFESRALEAGALAFVSKQDAGAELVRTLERVVDGADHN